MTKGFRDLDRGPLASCRVLGDSHSICLSDFDLGRGQELLDVAAGDISLLCGRRNRRLDKPFLGDGVPDRSTLFRTFDFVVGHIVAQYY